MLRILVVDDHVAARQAIISILRNHSDWQVCGEASNGVEAVARARELRPDVILMDVTMPEMDGLEATRAILEELPETKVVIVSQNDPAVVRKQAALAGAQAWVGKEAIAKKLVPAIEKLVSKDSATRRGRRARPQQRDESWLPADGEMSALIASTDWAGTPLGPTSSWSPALRMIVKFLLANRFPQMLWWGPEFCCLYNDAYFPILGTKHPSALGQPVRKVWHEIWDVLKPLIETPFSGGPATWMEDIALEMNRKGFFEETHFTIAYSPAPDETVPSGIGGVLATVHEITEQVVGERRVRALRDLGARSSEPKSVQEACDIVREELSRHPKDIPFLFLYLLDDDRRHARLGCSVGAEAGDRACPEAVEVTSHRERDWPFFEVLATENLRVVLDLKNKFDRIPQGPWTDAPTAAAVLPIRSNIRHQPAGFMVVGLSSRNQFDKSYRDFLELMSTQISTTVANARAYEEERKRAEALAEIDRVKTLFFSNVSHEFRTPLTLMMGPLEEVLSNPSALSPQQQERLDIAHRNSLRLLKLVNTLLDFSRLEAGRFETRAEPVEFAKVTCQLASLFEALTERAGLRLILNCPDFDEPVYLDRGVWEKIVFNLMSNAFKFTFEGEIEVLTRKNGTTAELIVRDTGTGIPPEDLPHLFERFYRVENARGRTFEGSGIGLALVQELAKLHGGAVRVESKVGVGTTFTVSIPLGKDHLPAGRFGAERPAASSEARSETYIDEALHWLPNAAESAQDASPAALLREGGPGAPERPRILLADDNADMREYVRKLLSPRFEVEVVPDGECALEAIRKRPPELILSDVMMPKLDGFELLRAVRADHRTATIPFIMLSARAGEESRIEGVAAGADDYLTKPFSARELVARVTSHLSMARLLRESNERNERERRLYLTILTNTPDLVYIFDLQHRFTYANEALLKMWGKTWEESIGKNCLELGYEPWHAAMHDREIEQVIATKKPIRGEVPFKASFGRRIYDYIFTPVMGPGGEVEAIAGTTRDITDLKGTEDALREGEERYRQLAETLDLEVQARTHELEKRSAEIVRQSEQLREVSWRLLRAQDQERRHIARELHDSAGQTLTVLGMNLVQFVQKTGRKNPELASDAESIQDMVQQLHRDIRTTSYLLHPPLLDESGLSSALTWYVHGLVERSQLQISLEISSDFGRLPRDMELVVFRLVQECLTNIHRHSGSTTASISIVRGLSEVTVEIKDEGHGMTPERMAEIQSGGAGVGIRGMRERLRQFAGEMKMESGEGGTRIWVVIPVPKIMEIDDAPGAPRLQSPI